MVATTSESGRYPPTPRTQAIRPRGRMDYTRTDIHRVLDETYQSHVGFVVDGEPRILPTLHVRLGETVYLHGSTGSRLALAARPAGVRVCLAVTVLDGLVLARAQAHHSANYRSVVVHGTATLVAEPDRKRAVLDALLDRLVPGRSEASRPPDPRELAQTAVLALPLTEASLRRRTGAPVDEPADLDLPYWAGVIPVRTSYGPPEPAPGVTAPPPTL